MDKLRQQLKQLYMICFPEDTEEYATFFVENKFDGTNCMTTFDGDKLIDMLFLVKKKMSVRGTVYNVPYMTAGGTLPEYRGRGIFTGVMVDAFKNFRKNNIPFTGLMPFDPDFYEKQAFVTHSFYKDVELTKGSLPIKEISFDQIDEMMKVYNTFMQDKNCWFYRDHDAFDLRLREIFLEGGKAYGLYENGEMQGYILTFDDEEIDEYCAYSPDVIFKFDTHFETVKENITQPGELDNMFRIVNNKVMLQTINYPKHIDTTISIFVDDWFFTENKGGYKVVIKDGKATVEEAHDCDFNVSIEDFTKLVCGCYTKGQFDKKLEDIFPPVLNCALDKF